MYHRPYQKGFDDPHRRSGTTTVGQALTDLVKRYRLDAKLLQTRVLSDWELIMGSTVASRTRKLYFHEKTLYCELSSAPLKQQLNSQRSKVLKAIIEHCGEVVAEDVVFL